MIPIETSAAGVKFKVKVHPRAKRNAVMGAVGDALKMALTAPLLEGKANRAVIEFFADIFEIPRSSVTIASGETGRLKGILISGMSAKQLRKALALEETK